MLGSEWLYGAIALLVGVHILTMLYAYRRQGEPTSGTTRSDSGVTTTGDDDAAVGLVACTHCGARNEQGYQFCRECAADLTSGSTREISRTGPNAH